jgi:DNA-binding MarR family transcriptional regulator
MQRLRRRLLSEQVSDGSPSALAVAILRTLNEGAPITGGDLARREWVQPPTMNRALDGLETRGWVIRKPDPNDGRALLADITSLGRSELRADETNEDSWLSRQLARLTPTEREVLREAAPVLEDLSRS